MVLTTIIYNHDMETSSKSTKASVFAIVPCYNEGPRIQGVLEALLKVRSLEAIIVVDDGSSDGSAQVVNKVIAEKTASRVDSNPIHLLIRAYNHGKSAAVLLGVLQASHIDPPPEYLLLLDADLRQVQADELELAVATVLANPEIDMLILRRVKKDAVTRLLGGDLLISGERIVRRSDLLEVLTRDPVSGYQIEVAINQYMLDHDKTVRWLPLTSTGVISFSKMGIWAGLKKEITMFSRLLAYLGLRRGWHQLMSYRHVKRAVLVES